MSDVGSCLMSFVWCLISNVWWCLMSHVSCLSLMSDVAWCLMSDFAPHCLWVWWCPSEWAMLQAVFTRCVLEYGVATWSRLRKIIRLFCERALWKRRYSAKETYHFKEPTNRSYPIPNSVRVNSHIHSHTHTHPIDTHYMYIYPRMCIFINIHKTHIFRLFHIALLQKRRIKKQLKKKI